MSTWSAALLKPVQLCTGMGPSSMANGLKGEYSGCLSFFLKPFLPFLFMHFEE